MPGSLAYALGTQIDNDATSLEFGDMPVFAPGSFDPVCGDGIRDPLEGCDGADFGQATCASLNAGTGTLTCTAGCTIDTANCTAASSSSSSSSTSSVVSSSSAGGSSSGGGSTGGGSGGGGTIVHSSQSSSPAQSSSAAHSSSSSTVTHHSASSAASSGHSAVTHASSAPMASGEALPAAVLGASGSLVLASSSAMSGAGTAPCALPETLHGAAPVTSEAWRLVLAGGVGVLLFLAAAGRPMFWFAFAKRRKHRAIDRRPATFSSRRISTR